jgi:hypothetical protein
VGKVNPLSGLPCAWTGSLFATITAVTFPSQRSFFFKQIEILPELHIEPRVAKLTREASQGCNGYLVTLNGIVMLVALPSRNEILLGGREDFRCPDIILQALSGRQ